MTNWPGLRDLEVQRRNPAVLAVVGFVIYFAGVIAFSELQRAVAPGLEMGWFQQAGSTVLLLGIAAFLGSPKELLGIRMPQGRWVLVAIGVGLSIALLGNLVDWFLPDPSQSQPSSAEYFAYEAIMPGLGEELGFRGLFLGLLATAGLQRGWVRGGGWPLLMLAALPFGLVHLFEVEGLRAVGVFFYAYYAGIALGWARMVTASIWPGVIAHNIANVVGGLINLILMS